MTENLSAILRRYWTHAASQRRLCLLSWCKFLRAAFRRCRNLLQHMMRDSATLRNARFLRSFVLIKRFWKLSPCFWRDCRFWNKTRFFVFSCCILLQHVARLSSTRSLVEFCVFSEGEALPRIVSIQGSTWVECDQHKILKGLQFPFLQVNFGEEGLCAISKFSVCLPLPSLRPVFPSTLLSLNKPFADSLFFLSACNALKRSADNRKIVSFFLLENQSCRCDCSYFLNKSLNTAKFLVLFCVAESNFSLWLLLPLRSNSCKSPRSSFRFFPSMPQHSRALRVP